MKQIIVMRNDLKNTEGHKVRSGKLMAQAAHASMGAILPFLRPYEGEVHHATYIHHVELRNLVKEWLANSFTKVVVRVDSEQELLDVVTAAQGRGMINCLITDNGTTEFGGVPTHTCAAIGPHADEDLAPVTGHLKLF